MLTQNLPTQIYQNTATYIMGIDQDTLNLKSVYLKVLCIKSCNISSPLILGHS